ncbi:MAG: hypothetical protein OXU20_21820 [Myxococcales bacterium]|nr:hypothetical protein [Myxococcales bacterium]MDD9970863.1 hypothetical protein [Myxococcales bacterium]
MKWLSGVLTSWVLVAALSQQASAQTHQERIEQLNREAMEAYNQLDINRAGRLLERALRLAQEGSVGGLVVAVTNLNLGMVYIGGLGDQQGGLAYFVAAICNEASIELDPLVSTPDMQQVFVQARAHAQQGGCDGGMAQGPAPAGQQQYLPQQVVQPVVHVPPTEQQTQTPLPLYVEVAPTLGATGVDLYYRGLGMDTYKQVPMYAFGQGMAYQITCNDVFEPKVSYYIQVVNDDGQVLASVGSPQVPIEVAVSTQMGSAAPALPGRPAPTSCVGGECPPGVECPQPGTAGIGEDCTNTFECQNGLICADGDVCLLDGAGGTALGSESGESADSGEFRRVFFQVGFTLGLAFATSGQPADSLPPLNRIYVNNQTGEFIEDPVNVDPTTTMPVLPFPADGQFPEQLTEWEPDADSADWIYADYAGDCSGDEEVTGPMTPTGEVRPPGDVLRLPSSYCVRVSSPGFVPAIALRFNAGYFITERFAASLAARLQLGSGSGTLASLLLGPRAEYMFTPPTNNGLMLSAFGGLTVGQIQVNPGFGDSTTKNPPFIRSGLMGLHVGGLVRYRLMPNFGFFAGPELDLQFPDTLFNIDLPIGVEGAL